jgi:hypothetical protein
MTSYILPAARVGIPVTGVLLNSALLLAEVMIMKNLYVHDLIWCGSNGSA